MHNFHDSSETLLTRRLESDQIGFVVTAAYSIGLSTVCDIKKQKDELQLFVESSEIVKGLSEGQTLK